jgi:hypothetical protein
MKHSQKNILDYSKTTRYLVVVFDRNTGKRLSSVGGCHPLRALQELSRNARALDHVALVLPNDTVQREQPGGNEITFEEALPISCITPIFY